MLPILEWTRRESTPVVGRFNIDNDHSQRDNNNYNKTTKNDGCDSFFTSLTTHQQQQGKLLELQLQQKSIFQLREEGNTGEEEQDEGKGGEEESKLLDFLCHQFYTDQLSSTSTSNNSLFLSSSELDSYLSCLCPPSSLLASSSSSWLDFWPDPTINLDRATSFPSSSDPLQVLPYFLRGSGGTGSSGPLGDVGAVVAQNLRPEGVSVNVNSASSWLPSTNQRAPRRCDSSELADSPTIKLVRDLNRAVATHVALAALLGGSGDGPHLRDELRRARRTAQERAAALRATLWRALDTANTRPPSPQSNESARWVEKERTELERLWHLLLCCLDSLETSMQRSLLLLREFSIADGSNILIHTGLDGVNPTRTYQTTSVEAGDVPLLDKLALEGAEASQLCKELFELRAQLLELKSAAEIRSLLSPPDCFVVEDISPMLKKNRRNDTLSINGNEQPLSNAAGSSISCSIASDDKESIESDLESQATGITGAQRKCVCLILAIMVTVFVLAMFLGVLVALLS